MSTSIENPPSNWAVDTKRVGDSDVYVRLGETPADTIVWHWCPEGGWGDGVPRWIGASIDNHTIVAREPLHIEASLLMTCCGWHGWIHDGEWVPA